MARVPRRPAAAVSPEHNAAHWREALKVRQHVRAPARDEERVKFRKRVLDDRARARRRMGQNRLQGRT